MKQILKSLVITSPEIAEDLFQDWKSKVVVTWYITLILLLKVPNLQEFNVLSC